MDHLETLFYEAWKESAFYEFHAFWKTTILRIWRRRSLSSTYLLELKYLETVERSEVFCLCCCSRSPYCWSLARYCSWSPYRWTFWGALRATLLGHRTVEHSVVFCALLLSATVLLNIMMCFARYCSRSPYCWTFWSVLHVIVLGYITVELSEVLCALLFSVTIVPRPFYWTFSKCLAHYESQSP